MSLMPVAPAVEITDRPGPDVLGSLSGERQSWWVRLTLLAVVAVPMAAAVAAVPVAWRWGLGWRDVVIGAGFYLVTGLGITVGFHRLFTHASFKANRALRVALAVAGSMAIEGPVIQWVADHRRHHQYSRPRG
jgi:stearoyl-CoA desaturase (delta-9 desaturase)